MLRDDRVLEQNGLRFLCSRAVESQFRDACRGEPPRLKLACELGDDVPSRGGGGALECNG